MTTPLLVFGWGNPSRGDDALGPLLVARLRETLDPAASRQVEFLEDFQLQVEHALDLVGRERVLFVDASVDCTAPYQARAIEPARDANCSTHALSAPAVLHVYRTLHDREAPPTWLLAIRGERFGLDEDLSPAAQRHLDAALAWARGWIAAPPAAIDQNPAASPSRLGSLAAT